MLNFNNIKVVVVDVDGCLSDGFYQISSDGCVCKSFYTRDFYAIEKAIKNNIDVVILTQSSDGIISNQINRICSSSNIWKENVISHKLIIIEGSDNKKKSIELSVFEDPYHIKKKNWSEVAYIGDSENDLECMSLSHFSSCPNDAIPSIMEESNYVSLLPGGKGAVYDIINFILERRKIENGNS